MAAALSARSARDKGDLALHSSHGSPFVGTGGRYPSEPNRVAQASEPAEYPRKVFFDRGFPPGEEATAGGGDVCNAGRRRGSMDLRPSPCVTRTPSPCGGTFEQLTADSIPSQLYSNLGAAGVFGKFCTAPGGPIATYGERGLASRMRASVWCRLVIRLTTMSLMLHRVCASGFEPRTGRRTCPAAMRVRGEESGVMASPGRHQTCR